MRQSSDALNVHEDKLKKMSTFTTPSNYYRK